MSSITKEFRQVIAKAWRACLRTNRERMIQLHREMRRKDRQLDPARAESILEDAEFGYLATTCPDGTPYVVPVNHVYTGGYIVFHCAHEGQKLDNIRSNPSVCYAVTTRNRLIPERFTTEYESALAFGKAEIVTDFELKKSLLHALMARLGPGVPFPCDDAGVERTTVVRIKVDVVTGKAND